MSQENVEIVRAGLAAWNTGDTDSLREAIDPEHPREAYGSNSSREAWDTDAMAPISFTDAGDRGLVQAG